MDSSIEQRVAIVKNAIDSVDKAAIEAFVDILERACHDGNTIYTCGNGGSASTASHMVNDLCKGACKGSKTRLRAACLNDNVPLVMAYANDIGYASIFEEQLRTHLRPADVLVAISGSGNSPNVISAVDYTNNNGGISVGMCGYSGGQLKQKARCAIHVPLDDMETVESVHSVFCHIAVQMLRDKLRER